MNELTHIHNPSAELPEGKIISIPVIDAEDARRYMDYYGASSGWYKASCKMGEMSTLWVLAKDKR